MDENIEEVFQFYLDPKVEANQFFHKIDVQDMYDTCHKDYITKPRIDAKKRQLHMVV